MPSSLAELSGLLWRERDVLEDLADLLRDGRDGAESEGLLRSIRSLELHRAITAREVAVELGLEGDPSLQDIVEVATGEWAAILAGHRRVLLGLREELENLVRADAVRSAGNVVTLPSGGSRARGVLQRSLRDFLR